MRRFDVVNVGRFGKSPMRDGPIRSLLVIGLKELNAGKTTLAQALLLYLRDEGVDACGFKPRAGNNVWYDYDIVCESLSQGRLYGKDAKLLKQASGTALSEEVINPVHRLWAEPFRLNLISQVPNFIVDRVTLCDNGTRNILIVNEPLAHKFEEPLKNLHLQTSEVHGISNVEDLNRVTEEYYDRAVELAYRKVTSQHESIVIEGYSDIALQWGRFGKPDVVLGVEPGRVVTYNPDKYLTAVELSVNLRTEVTSSNIQHLLRPMNEVRIPPSRSSEAVKKLKVIIPELLHV